MAQQDSSSRMAGGSGQRTAGGEELGRSFEAQSSRSFGGDLGRSFEEHNSSRAEWEHKRHAARRRTFWILGLAVVVVVFLVIFFVTKPKDGVGGSAASGKGGRGQGAAVITVGQSTTGSSPVYEKALGTVTPINTVTVYSQITGRVIAVHYHEGQLVQKGQPLVDIDPQPYQAQLKQAEGTLAQAEGTLLQSRATLDEARMDLDRYRAALSRNAIARQTVEDQEKLVAQDEAAVRSNEGTVKADQGTVDYDRVQLSYCHIVAPIGGKVGLRLVDPGNTVFSGTGSTLVVITQLSPITVVFNVAEDSLPEIQQQLKQQRSLPVDVFDRSDAKTLANGTLSSLDNQIDTTTGTLKFRAAIPNADLSLVPNQFVNARLLVKTLENVVQVPAAAVQQNGTQAFVYLVHPAPAASAKDSGDAAKAADGKGASGSQGTKGEQGAPKGQSVQVTVQNVTVLTSNDRVAAITGLQAGQQVATSGFDRLENGAKATVQQGKPAAKATSDSSTGTQAAASSAAGGNGSASGGKGGQ